MKTNSFNFFIGIDISKDKFNYAILDDSMKLINEGNLNMNTDGFNFFNKILKTYPDSFIALESTGNYHLNLLSFLSLNKYTIALINPLLIKKFIQSFSLRKTKTDKIDALIIAKYAFKNIENIHSLVPSITDDILALARTREELSKQIAKTKTQLKNHIVLLFPELTTNYNIFTDFILSILERFPSAHSIINAPEIKIKALFDNLCKRGRKPKLTYDKFIELAKNSIALYSENYEFVVKLDVQRLKFLNLQIRKITKIFLNQMEKLKKNDMDIMKSIKGISDITSAHFLVEIKNINRFENKRKLAAFAGIDPAVKQSGNSLKKGRISKKGSKSLRRYLYLMANSLIRSNDYFKNYYQKKKSQGMHHRKAIIALCNKLVRILFALLSNNQKFISSFHNSL